MSVPRGAWQVGPLKYAIVPGGIYVRGAFMRLIHCRRHRRVHTRSVRTAPTAVDADASVFFTYLISPKL